MSEILLSSKFAGSGGAANDSTSCSAAIAAAASDLAAANGGTIVFDAAGICRNTVKTQITPYAPIRLKGHGDNAVRLMNLADRHLSFTAQDQTLEVDGMVILGALGSFGTVGYSSNNNPAIYLGGAVVSLRNTKILGVTASSAGAVEFNNCMASIDGCSFSGSAADLGVILMNNWRSFNIKNCEMVDYATYAGNLYSRTPDVAGAAWIRIMNPQTPNADAQKSFGGVIENVTFDEGAGSSVHMVGGDSIKVLNCRTNAGSGFGYYFEGVKHVVIENTWVGYNTNVSQKALTLKDVDYARLDGLRLGQNVDYIEITGNTKEVDIIGGDLNVGHNVTYPTSIYNPANAIVRVNGIRQRGTVRQIG